MNNSIYWESASRARKFLYNLSLLLVLIPIGIFFFRVFPKYFAAMQTLLVRLPLSFSVPIIVVESGACAVIIAEMIRAMFPSRQTWPDRKHFIIVSILWLITLSCQLGFFFIVRKHGGFGSY
jgi:hypothetical protein